MPSSKSFLDYILDQLFGLEGISARAMMGEFLIYYRGKLIGGIYDNRLLVKPTESAGRLLPGAAREKPYEGAKDMLPVEDTDDRSLLETLFLALYDELPEPKSRRR